MLMHDCTRARRRTFPDPTHARALNPACAPICAHVHVARAPERTPPRAHHCRHVLCGVHTYPHVRKCYAYRTRCVTCTIHPIICASRRLHPRRWVRVTMYASALACMQWEMLRRGRSGEMRNTLWLAAYVATGGSNVIGDSCITWHVLLRLARSKNAQSFRTCHALTVTRVVCNTGRTSF
jgi:hypothetical protein